MKTRSGKTKGGLTPKAREQTLEFCRLASGWYLGNQNTEQHHWGVGNSADLGRFLYQYNPVTGDCRGNGVWGQGLAIMGLLPLARRLDWAGEPQRNAAISAAKYLMSLQIMDRRDERLFGALREGTPQTPWIHVRDGATGAMAFCALYRETEEEEYLYRARVFADWYLRNALGKDGWPCYTYYFETHESKSQQPAIWQAGAALMFYYLNRLTGDKKYVQEGLRPLMEGYKRLYRQAKDQEPSGNDDFTAVSAMGATLLYKDPALGAIVRQRAQELLECQDADGSCAGLEGEYVAGITWQNYCEYAQKRKLPESLAPYREAIRRAAAFIQTRQERCARDLRAYGGVYGQTSYGASRSLIHHRATGYALIFMLRQEGGVEVPGYNIFGW